MRGEIGQMLLRVRAVERLEGERDAMMQPSAASRTESLVEGVVDERVLERELADLVGRFVQQGRADRRVELIEQQALGDLNELGQQGHVEGAADHRGDRQ